MRGDERQGKIAPILLTGGARFISPHFAEALLRRGDSEEGPLTTPDISNAEKMPNYCPHIAAEEGLKKFVA